jgi:hypothetical protein
MLELLMMCAPAVDPVTMAAVVKQESGGQPVGDQQQHHQKISNF